MGIKIIKYRILKNTFGGLILPDFKTYYKSKVNKIVWCWHKYRCLDQWSRTESSEIDIWLYGQLFFDKLPRMEEMVLE